MSQTTRDGPYRSKRFWCPPTGHPNLGDGGYLYDPESRYGYVYNPDLVSFDKISHMGCLILLGEPGMGKTHTMRSEYPVTREAVTKSGGNALWLDLGGYGSEVRLIGDLFEGKEFDSWKQDRWSLHVFLDALDECRIQIPSVGKLLVSQLQRHVRSPEQLFLRIICRAADWPKNLEAGLEAIWGKQRVGKYELAPLRRKDIREAAAMDGVDPDAFMTAVEEREVVPLAIKPITLRFLISTYSQSGKFPHTQAELYAQGSRLLCREWDTERSDASRQGRPDADQLLAVSARIAALTIFGGFHAIWIGANESDAHERSLFVRDIVGGKEIVHGNSFDVTELNVRAALATGLFSSQGSDLAGWAHQTYGEYLAARYLAQRNLRVPQMMDLLVHSSDPDRRLAPQLHETAAWLAGMVPEIFQRIVTMEPEVLLQSDVATASAADRANLVMALLSRLESEALLGKPGAKQDHSQVAYPGMAEQLRPLVQDKSRNPQARGFAITLAGECDVRELLPDLCAVTLDLSEQHYVRVQAAAAICQLGDDAFNGELKPLAIGRAGDDPDDQLKGLGLRATWPSHLSGPELFGVLTEPKRDNLIGTYFRFVSQRLTEDLPPAILPVALRWVAEQQSGHRLWTPFRDLIAAVIRQAESHLHIPAVLKAYARIVLLRIHLYDDSIYVGGPGSKVLAESAQSRRDILAEMIPPLSDTPHLAFHLADRRKPFVTSDDIPWLLERLLSTQTENEQTTLAKLVRAVFNPDDPDQVEAIFLAVQCSSVLAETFAAQFNPVDLESPIVETLRNIYRAENGLQEQTEERIDEQTVRQRIALMLDTMEAGDHSAWWRLNLDMMLEPGRPPFVDDTLPNLKTSPGWKMADQMTRARILQGAERYLMTQEADIERSLSRARIYRDIFAGYRAMSLLFQEVPDRLGTLSPAIWARWAPIILAYPLTGESEEERIRRGLISLAYEHAPDQVAFVLGRLIESECRELKHIYITNELEECWDERLLGVLLEKATNPRLEPQCMRDLLDVLLQHNYREARAFAESLIVLPLARRGRRRERAIASARVLMMRAQDVGWPLIWPLFQRYPAVGRSIIQDIANSWDEVDSSVAARLIEDQVATLFLWLCKQYPISEDPQDDMGGWVTPRQAIKMWRFGLLDNLKRRGTAASCRAIRLIADAHPELDWLKWSLRDAIALTRCTTWVPPNPREILELTNRQDRRLVESGEQLLDVLIEALEELGLRLQGETPVAVLLWNEIAEAQLLDYHTRALSRLCAKTNLDVSVRKALEAELTDAEKTKKQAGNMISYRPKDENRLSDFVKGFLTDYFRERGVVVNREVEIRRGEGSYSGERTDIRVDALAQRQGIESYDSITVIIETKGCWHNNLDRAMETQLVNRYLKDNRCQHGLYLVGWLDCEQWDARDPRRARCRRISLAEARERFAAQASRLSTNGIRLRSYVLNAALRSGTV